MTVSREDRLVDVYVLSLASDGTLPPAKPPVDKEMPGFRSSGVTFKAPGNLDGRLRGQSHSPSDLSAEFPPTVRVAEAAAGGSTVLSLLARVAEVGVIERLP